jgi:hypothetical protein
MTSRTSTRRRPTGGARILLGSIMAVSFVMGLGVASVSDVPTGVQAAAAAMSALATLAALRWPGRGSGADEDGDDEGDRD